MEQLGISRGTAAFIAVAVVVGAYAVYVGEQAKADRLARERQRVSESQARDAAKRREAAQALQEGLERRRQAEAAQRAAMTPADLRRQRLQAQFSGWDGSHRAVEQAIKARMNNPKSYEHVGTTYVDHGIGRGLRVISRSAASIEVGLMRPSSSALSSAACTRSMTYPSTCTPVKWWPCWATTAPANRR